MCPVPSKDTKRRTRLVVPAAEQEGAAMTWPDVFYGLFYGLYALMLLTTVVALAGFVWCAFDDGRWPK
jgi:Flp pilus assembly pilin Flp